MKSHEIDCKISALAIEAVALEAAGDRKTAGDRKRNNAHRKVGMDWAISMWVGVGGIQKTVNTM